MPVSNISHTHTHTAAAGNRRKLEHQLIASLDEEDALLAAAADLAVRHVAYNVTADQYALVGQALLDTLRELLGTKFDPATEAAWAETYTGLSQHMISSAYG